MAKFDEMPFAAKLGIMLVVAGIVAGGFYYLQLRSVYEDIEKDRTETAAINRENDTLKQFVPKLAALDKHLIELEQQLVEEKRIVPDEAEADKFITLLHDTAAAAGIEIRRYTAMPNANHDFYTEVPFQLDLDGPYFSMLNFFDRIGKLERIINIGNLQMSNTKETAPSKVKMTYPYAPTETVVASCTATTFFSHEMIPSAVTKPATAKP